MSNKGFMSRRLSNPHMLQLLWDAIKIIRFQRQVPNRERVTRYMSREHGMSKEQVAFHLNNCVEDGLIVCVKKVGIKGNQAGVEQEGYAHCKEPCVRDSHDWYCFECHVGGLVICCSTCCRVYHPLCCGQTKALDQNEVEEDVKRTFICKVCLIANESEDRLKIKKKDLNQLLRYVCARLEGRLPPVLMSRQVPNSASYPTDQGSTTSSQNLETLLVYDQDDDWRIDLLIYETFDLTNIQRKIDMKRYRRLEEMQMDVATLVHYVVIFHGLDSIVSVIARQMYLDCTYDIAEIYQCADCYRRSNEMRGRHWFCKPCRPPHELVFAKQNSFPYWPAKVIRVDDANKYDVRFFGSQHERAVVDKNKIRPITATIRSLKVKRSLGWNKAFEELKLHQKMLEKVKKVENSPVEESSSEEEGEEQEEKLKMEVKEEDMAEETPPPKKRKVKKVVWRKRKRSLTESESEVASDPESDAPQEEEVGSYRNNSRRSSIAKDRVSQEDMVSSSCQESRFRSIAVQASSKVPKKQKKIQSKSAMSKLLRQQIEAEKQKAIDDDRKEVMEQLAKEHKAHVKQLREEFAAEISEVKLKQWCFNCEKAAIYHCCWNTAYCSIQCQQDHWITEHKPHCRRATVNKYQ